MQSIHEIPDMPPVAEKPFCHGVVAEGKFLHVAGQGPWDPALGKFASGSIAEQTRLTLECIGRVLRQAGATPTDVVSVKVYLQPLTLETWQEMNVEFTKFFGSHKPARTAIGCTLLGINVEMDAVALVP
jgi:2-iminobutanoate/2-iminopropanoate deaminase